MIFNPDAYGRFCLTIANPEVVRGRADTEHSTVIVVGRFVENYIDLKHELDLGACSSSAIVVDKVLEVR